MLHLAIALLSLAPVQTPASPAPPVRYEAIEEATARCDLGALQTMLGQKRTDLDRTDGVGGTLVHTAVVLCEPAVVTLLIGAGASVDGGAGDATRHTPLMMAAMQGKTAMVEALVAAKADVNRVVGGMSALSCAVGSNQLATIVALARAGASLSDPIVRDLLPRASEATRALVDLCAVDGRTCSVEILLETAPAMPAASWWTSTVPCEAPTTFRRDGDIVRCGCAGAFHGPFAELYPGTAQPLALGRYRGHKRHGVWTTFTRTGTPVERTTFFEDAPLRVERLGDAVIPPVAPSPWLSRAEREEADLACATDAPAGTPPKPNPGKPRKAKAPGR